jgi:hypothetical protein
MAKSKRVSEEDLHMQTMRVVSLLNQICIADLNFHRAQDLVRYYKGISNGLKVVPRDVDGNLSKWSKDPEALRKRIEEMRIECLEKQRISLETKSRLKKRLDRLLPSIDGHMIFSGGTLAGLLVGSDRIPSSRFAEISAEYEAVAALNQLLEKE